MQAGLEGRIQIVLNPATQTVKLDIQRPLAAIQQLLVGKTVEQALERIPLLFSICSHAQSLAALRACQAALGQPIKPELQHAQQQLVNLETQREHVLRILLDSSAWLGQAPNPALVQQVMRVLPQARQTWFKDGKAFNLNSELVSAELMDWQAWQAFLAQHIFALPLSEWACFNTLSDLQLWINATPTVAAQSLAQLQQQDLARLGANDFTLVHEASVLKRQAQHPLMQAALAEYGNGVFTRQLARLVELVHTPVWTESWVQAARGALQHQVVLSADQTIASYKILAPTDANFAANGIAAAGLQALLKTINDQADLEQQARLWIATIDPCVAYDLEWQYA